MKLLLKFTNIWKHLFNLIKKYPVITFILCCLIPVHGILWTALFLGADQEILKPLKLPFALLPTISAIFISWLIGDSIEVQKLLKRTLIKSTPIWVYLVSFISFIFISFLALLVRYFWDGFWPSFSEFAPLWQILLISPFLLLFPGIAEEFGWRGFMQERLNQKILPFFASVFVGLIWGTWHGMDFLMGNFSSEFWSVILFFVYIIGVSVIIGKLYNLSGGNIFIAMLAHFSANAVNFFIPVWKTTGGFQTPIIFLVLIWATAIVILLFEMFKFFKEEQKTERT